MTAVWVRHSQCQLQTLDFLADFCWIDLGLKKKKKKAKKDTDDDFAAKLAALDIEKEADDELAEQEGDMCGRIPFQIALMMEY